MPTRPVVEPFEQTASGLHVAGTAWSVQTDLLLLQVLALDFDIPVTEAMADGSFDASIAGMARRGKGHVVSDEPIPQAGGWARSSVIEIDGGRIYVEHYAVGTWVVSILAGSPNSTPPATFEALVDSFSFT